MAATPGQPPPVQNWPPSDPSTLEPVSYTHLTLPTNREV